jgi:hypothetical protein
MVFTLIRQEPCKGKENKGIDQKIDNIIDRAIPDRNTPVENAQDENRRGKMLHEIAAGGAVNGVLPGDITAKAADSNHGEINQPIPDAGKPQVFPVKKGIDQNGKHKQQGGTEQKSQPDKASLFQINMEQHACQQHFQAVIKSVDRGKNRIKNHCFTLRTC